MPCRPHVTVWMALLSACRIHGSVEMGEHIAKVVLELEPEMLQFMCCYQTSMLQLAAGISARMFNGRERNKV